jgi:hypothetical protein
MQYPNIKRSLLNDYIHKLSTELPDQIVGIYLYGSIPLGGYNEKTSDIDFVTVLKDQPNDYHFEVIKRIHQQLALVHPKANTMDGMYIPYVELGKSNNELQPYPFVHAGKVQRGHWDINHVTWWSLKTFAFTLYGKNHQELPIQTTWSDVEDTMDYNLNSYWKNRASRIETLLEPEDVADAVLTLCRIHYTLSQKIFLPKIKAGIKFLEDYEDHQFYNLVHEAIRLRDHSLAQSFFENEKVRAQLIVEFIDHMILVHSNKSLKQ